MAKIWTMGEILVEIMRTKPDVPFNKVGEFKGPFPSGAPAIFIDAVAKLGHEAGIIGGVGKDGFGEITIERLKEDGVNCDHVYMVKNKSTAVAFVTYFSDGSREYIFHVENTPATMVHDVKNIKIKADVFHIMGCSLMFNEKFRQNILEVMEKFYENGAKISFDPNVRKELMNDENIDIIKRFVLPKTVILLPGENELKILTRIADVDEAVKTLFEEYDTLEIVALKRGKAGSVVFSRNKKVEIPPFEVREIDPTGAGDYFDAVFVCGILEGRDLFNAGKMASIAGALNAASFGPMEGILSREIVEKYIDYCE